MESFFCPSVLYPDHEWKHTYRVDIKFSNLISFREEVKYTIFMAVNCPKKVYYVFVSASPSCLNYFKPFGLTLQYSSVPVLQSSAPVQYSSPALQSTDYRHPTCYIASRTCYIDSRFELPSNFFLAFHYVNCLFIPNPQGHRLFPNSMTTVVQSAVHGTQCN